jgi:ACS family hexuronate transporter-like MFS transporter
MKYESRLIWILGITFGFLFFDRNAANFLMPFIASDLHFNNRQVGLVASALSFTWAISAFLGGLYSDHSGRRKPILLATTLAFSLCSFLSGLAGSFLALFLVRMLMGAAEGPFMPVAQSLVARESSEERRGHNMGVLQNFGSNILGSFAAPLVLVAIATAWTWRVSFFMAGLPGLVMAVLIARYVHEPAPVAAADAAAAAGAAATQRAGPKLRDMLGHRNMWLCMIMSIVMVAWMVIGWAFLPLFYTKVRQLPASTMSWLMSVLGLSAAFFSFVVPRLSDRYGRRPVVVVFNLVGLLVPLAVLYYGGSVYALALLVFLGWSGSGTFPLFMSTIPSESIPAGFVATSVGMVVGLGEVLGGVSGPALAGWAADIYGLKAPLVIEGACALVGMVLALFLVETAPVRVRGAAAARSFA